MNLVKITQAVFHPKIVGYGVSDSALRFGGGDETAEHGLCYPNSDPLTLRQAVDLKLDIGDDAAVIAFFDGKRDPEIVDLGCELPIPAYAPPPGWTKGERVTRFEELRRGHLLIGESHVHARGCYRNLIEITSLPGVNLTFGARFVDPVNPNRLRAGADQFGFAIWPYEFARGALYFRALPSWQSGKGIAFGEIRNLQPYR